MFPIVGIGTSAGGLEALELFFRHVPAECGMAFVVIQHLLPTHAGNLPELLQRSTSVKVFQSIAQPKFSLTTSMTSLRQRKPNTNCWLKLQNLKRNLQADPGET